MQIIASNAIIGSATGYDNGQIHNFLHSLSKIAYKGKVILFVDAGRGAFVDYHLDLTPIYIDRTLTEDDRKSPAMRRYFWIREFLARCRVTGRILLTDVRDVVFQSDPFESKYALNTPLLLALEERSIGECPYNSNWIAKMYGAGVLDSLQGYIISCSGTTLGDYDSICSYLKKMCRHITTAPDITGVDQGIHNFIINRDPIEGQRLNLNGLGFVATLGYMHRLGVSNGCALNYDENVVPMVHQYDRLSIDVQRQIAAIDVLVG